MVARENMLDGTARLTTFTLAESQESGLTNRHQARPEPLSLPGLSLSAAVGAITTEQ
jgi:hypothetical protein